MKTNQLLHVRIGRHTLPIEHKTMMGSLTDLWAIGNAYRIEKGRKPLDMSNFMRSLETLEFVEATERRLGLDSKVVELTDSISATNSILDKPIQSPLIKAKRGKGGGTWAHLFIMLDAAGRLDADFRLEMYETFVAGKILQWRDDSGDEFIHLNTAIDLYLSKTKSDGTERTDNKGIYIQVAVKLKDKIAPDGGAWNTASSQQLEERYRLENRLCDLLRLGVVRDYEHLKEIIDKL